MNHESDPIPGPSQGVRQAHPERVSPGDSTTTVRRELVEPHSATPVRGEPVEPHSATPVRGELVEPPATSFESLHPNARWGLRLSHALLFFFPVAGPSAALMIAFDALGSPGVRVTLWAALALAAFVLGWNLGNARWRRTRYALDGDALRIRRGLVWRSETLVPRSRVQHTDINRGPLDRRLGLATLKVYTAGTRLAHVSLDGLPAERAVQLRDALVAADADVL